MVLLFHGLNFSFDNNWFINLTSGLKINYADAKIALARDFELVFSTYSY